MKHYAACQRINAALWDWTCNEGGTTYPAGSCWDGKCEHATQEEAQEHESQRVRLLIKNAMRIKIDTTRGHPCRAHGLNCQDPAFFEVVVENFHYTLCEHHLNDVSWYRSTEIHSSY